MEKGSLPEFMREPKPTVANPIPKAPRSPAMSGKRTLPRGGGEGYSPEPRESRAYSGGGPESSAEGESHGLGLPEIKFRLLPDLAESFAKLKEWASSLVQKLLDRLPERTTSEPEKTAAAQVRAKEKEATPEAPPTQPPVSTHAEAKLAQAQVGSAEQEAILAELKLRKERNQRRRAALDKLTRTEETLLIALEHVYTKPMSPRSGLPHRVAFDEAKKVREFVEGKTTNLSPADLKSSLEASKANVERQIEYYQDPLRRFRPDNIRERYFSPAVTHPASALLKELSEGYWTPLESEAIEDIIRSLGLDCGSSFGSLK